MAEIQEEIQQEAFPMFNYAFYPDGSQQQSFIDYGSSSSYDLDINKDDRSIYTRSKHYHYYCSSDTFVGLHATLPLFRPSSTVFPTRSLPNARYYRLRPITDFRMTIIEQIGDFYREYPDITFPVGRQTVNELLDCEPWNIGSFGATKSQELREHFHQPLGISKCEFQRFAKSLVTNPLYHSHTDIKINKEDQVRTPKGLRSGLLDIHPDLLFELVNESINQQKHELLHFDLFQGNILAYCRFPGNLSSNNMLFYPSGLNLETLNLNVLTFEIKDGEWIPKPSLVNPCDDIVIDGAIRQIDAASVQGSVVAATRTQYSCRFLGIQDDSNEQITLKAMDNFQCEDELVHLSVSPYIHGDAVVVTNKGQVHIWKCGNRVDTLDTPSLAPDKRWPWYQSVYGGHPRCILITNTVEADIMDIRTNRAPQSFFSINSKQVDLHERISAVQRHPLNTHHYFIATDQSLHIMDDRYLQHPVLKWHHHLQDPVQFIQVLPDVMPNCDDSIIIVSGSLHRETHCFQYSSGKPTVSQTLTLIGNHIVTPPVSTSSPWKVCSYDVWPSLLPPSALPLSSIVDDRLKHSLIGLTCVPQQNNGFTVLQMSSLGDLFYQPLIPKTTQQKFHMNSKTNSPCANDSSFCKEWIKDLIEMENASKRKQIFLPKINASKTDCISEFLSMISLKTPHASCALCMDYIDCPEKEINSVPTGTICPCCGIDVTTGRQLKNAKNQNTVTTSKCCSFGEPSLDLNIFTEEKKFQNSVSQGFRYNWISEEPQPIELTNKTPQDETNNNNDDTGEIKLSVVISEIEQKGESSNIDDSTFEIDQTLKAISTMDNNISSMPSTKCTMGTTGSKSTSNTYASTVGNEEKPDTMLPTSNSNLSSTTNAIVKTMPVDNIVSMKTNDVTMENMEPVTRFLSSPSKGNKSSPVKAKKKKLGLSMGF